MSKKAYFFSLIFLATFLAAAGLCQEYAGKIIDIKVDGKEIKTKTDKVELSADGETWQQTQIGDSIYVNYEIRTKPDGFASIELADDKKPLKLYGDSEIKIEKSQKWYANLLKGKFWTISNIFFKTTKATGGPTGTEYLVSHAEAGDATYSAIYTFKGVVNVGITGTDKDTTLFKGQGVRIVGTDFVGLAIPAVIMIKQTKDWTKILKPKSSWFKPWYLIPLAIPPVVLIINKPPPNNKATVDIIVDVPPGN